MLKNGTQKFAWKENAQEYGTHWCTLYIAPKGQGSGMAHIGVHCTFHKMAMLKNGTYLCKLQLHVDMGSIIHFCTDTNTQNRTNFTKSLNTRFITENAKTSTFILFKILWTFHHHVSWQASELLFLHHSIAKFDQQSNFHVEDDLMHKTSVFQVYNLRNFCLENC
jgi:hypothetical protein